ncbi:MAG TPA: NrfD/PsrC family molybdoenzyme membrane anchor subunit [Dissulfurispiraceae bacterium]|nr:NrfD/PsrC family molybdoenzyme membrane anchor subunit [Dissulfurispiraceae bacterium]
MSREMNFAAQTPASQGGYRTWFMDKLFMGMSASDYARSLLTPFNIIAAAILTASVPVFMMRYVTGLSTVVDATNEYPWGLLLSWGIFAGEPLFAAGFVVAAAYYLFGMKSYRPLVRLAVLGGMLGYAFAASYLLIDLGRPWRIYYPMLVNLGPSSVLFIVAWHVALYCTVQVLEFSPAILEWLGSKRLHKWAVSVTVALIIGGVILSTVHQSALGAMYLITPGKLHPLWYSSHLPLLFFSSAVYAAMSFAILLAFVAVRYFRNKCDEQFVTNTPPLTLSLGKGAALAMYVYLSLKILALAQDNRWGLLLTPNGYWYLVELIGFVVAPMVLFTIGVKRQSLGIIRSSAFFAVIGIVLNRVNVNLIAYNWNQPNHFHHIIPPLTEVMMIMAVVTLHVLVFRWILNRFPVMRELPEYKGLH